MTLLELQLTGFKNYESRSFGFEGGINCIVGKNGLGKTNLLDAIHYLCFAKTAFSNTDAQNICEDEKFLTLYGVFKDDLKVACQYERARGKTLKVDGREVQKLSNHVGRIPLVLTTPDDNDLIRDGSEFRRKFFDGAIAQSYANYLRELIQYNRLLKQRNELLKQAEHPAQVNYSLLDTYDAQMIPLAKSIVQQRVQFLDAFEPLFAANYSALMKEKENPSVVLQTDVSKNFEDVFRASREKDVIMQRTLTGPHRDQYDFTLNDKPLKKFGSQGQQKTFVLSLKLAEYDLLSEITGKKPLLLLDDIFDKLDDDRIQSLIAILEDQERFEQVFITDARKDRSYQFL